MDFFYVKDHKLKYRFFSTERFTQIEVKFSRWKLLWEKAKKKLRLLPMRIFIQEQAFGKVLTLDAERLTIYHSGKLEKRKLKTKFFFFLQRQRSIHILILIGETILLPVSGLLAILPGPNVFFGVLAILMVTHWQALRGINALLKKNYNFVPVESLGQWEAAVESRNKECFLDFLQGIQKEFHISDLQKILWK